MLRHRYTLAHEPLHAVIIHFGDLPEREHVLLYQSRLAVQHEDTIAGTTTTTAIMIGKIAYQDLRTLAPTLHQVGMINCQRVIDAHKCTLRRLWVIKHNSWRRLPKMADVRDLVFPYIGEKLIVGDVQVLIKRHELHCASDWVVQHQLRATQASKIAAIDHPVARQIMHLVIGIDLHIFGKVDDTRLTHGAIVEEDAILIFAREPPDIHFPIGMPEIIHLAMYNIEILVEVHQHHVRRAC